MFVVQLSSDCGRTEVLEADWQMNVDSSRSFMQARPLGPTRHGSNQVAPYLEAGLDMDGDLSSLRNFRTQALKSQYDSDFEGLAARLTLKFRHGRFNVPLQVARESWIDTFEVLTFLAAVRE